MKSSGFVYHTTSGVLARCPGFLLDPGWGARVKARPTATVPERYLSLTEYSLLGLMICLVQAGASHSLVACSSFGQPYLGLRHTSGVRARLPGKRCDPHRPSVLPHPAPVFTSDGQFFVLLWRFIVCYNSSLESRWFYGG